MSQKRIAVTLPAGPRISDTIDRIRWAEENGIPDAWFPRSAVGHHGPRLHQLLRDNVELLCSAGF